MIFVTVGTTKFPFNRLLKAIDKTMMLGSVREKIVVQAGVSSYQFGYRYKEVYKELPFNKMLFYFKKARVVITSGGPASIFLALKYGNNNPLIVPRSGKLGEHVDEHEVMFGKFIKSEKNIEVISINEDLVKQIARYLVKPIVNNKYRQLVTSSDLIKKLTNLTASYVK